MKTAALRSIKQLALATIPVFTAVQLQSAVLLQETFNNGTPGSEMGFPNQPTSDGNGVWFGSPETFYGGPPENPNYEIGFTQTSPGLKVRALNYEHNGDPNGIDTIPRFTVRIGNVRFEGHNGASAIFISPRHTQAHLGHGYRFSPIGTANPPTGWNVYYVGVETGPATLIGTLTGATPEIENLELRVWENYMRLYTNGVPFDPAVRPTMGTAGTGSYQRPLEIIANAAQENVLNGSASVKVVLDDVTIITPESQPPFEDTPAGTLLAYEGFNYSPGTLLNDANAGGMGWVGPYMREQNTSSAFLDSLSAIAHASGFSYGELEVEGSACSIIPPGTVAPENARRSLRWIDVDSMPAELKTDDGLVLRKTGQKLWLSVLAQRVDTSKAGFFGISLYSNLVETIFLGKSGAANQTNWRVESKNPNITGLTTINADNLAFLLLLIEWNHDGSLDGSGSPVNPDAIHLWVNPPLESEPEKSTAAAVSVRNSTGTQNPLLYFNRVGFRGLTSGGVLDEFRLGTTFRSVAPIPQSEPPSLSVTRNDSSVVIRWRTTVGFVLQQSESLDSPQWLLVGETPGTDGDDSVVTLNTGAATQFFRLEKP